jgi:putative ABC transport system permease protein
MKFREHGESLPPRIVELIEEWIAESGVDAHTARRVRQDLEQHFRDGLAAGRTADDLIAAFGDPRSSAALLKRAVGGGAPPPRPTSAVVAATVADGVVADVRFALRVLRSSPVYTLTVVGILALGIGANTVAFTLLSEIVLRPLPVEDPSSLVNVIAEVPGGNSFSGFSLATFEAFEARNDVLEDLVAFSGIRVRLGDETVPREVVATLASPNYFQALGVAPTLGSVTLPPFTGWGVDTEAVISHRLWQSALGGAGSAIGSTIRLDGRPFTVIGVAARDFTGTFIGFPTDVWLPLSTASVLRPGFDPEDRSQTFLELLGRRRSQVTVAEVDVALDAIALDLERAYPESNRGHRVRVRELTGLEDSLRDGVLGFLAIVVVVSALVLLVACLNVGSILLVRAMSRERELAIRIAVGAGGRRLLRQLLTETVLVSGAGTVVALILAAWATRLLGDFVRTVSGGLGLEMGIDWRVLSLTMVAALAAASVAALAPGVHVLRKDPAGVLRQQGAGAGRATNRARSALVVGQVGLSVVLAVSAGLFVRSLGQGLRVDPGFDPDHMAEFTVSLDREGFDGSTARVLRRDLLGRIRALTGVPAAASTTTSPLGVARTPKRISIPGTEPPPGESGFLVDVKEVGSGYFEAVGIELLAGLPFTRADDGASQRKAVVSRAFVERFFEGRLPLGGSFEVDATPVRVVGVAEDVRYLLQDETPDPLVYLSWSPDAVARYQIVVRAASPPAELRSPIQEVVNELHPARPVVILRTARETLSDALLPQRVGAVLVGFMGTVAVLLSSLGLYGLVQYTVSRETRALGVRLALGGGRMRVLGSVLLRGASLVTIGVTLGVAAALLVAPALGPFLVGVEPSDPATYGLVLMAFAVVALGATFVPAVRAANIDPAETLRAE